MSADLQPLFGLLGRSVTDTAGAAAQINALRFDRGTLWLMMVLVTVLSVLLFQLSISVLPIDVAPEMARISPFALCVVLGSGLIMLVFALYFTGQMLGGTGRFPGALLFVLWWQALALALQVIQTFTLLFAPVLGQILTIAGALYMFYALVHFVNVLHDFHNLFKAGLSAL